MVWSEYEIEVVNLKDANRFRQIEAFLAEYELSFDDSVEYTIAVRRSEEIVGTGSFSGEILRNIAVSEKEQGAGLTSLILSSLMQEQARRGRMHYFIFTKPAKAHLFTNLGFTEIARDELYTSLLETGLGSIEKYCSAVVQQASSIRGKRAAVIVNCNPFTKGHQALIRKAAGENDGVVVFVVSEDQSLFPFADRIKLVREGVADLTNVVVVPSGKYMVSSATFPTYFTREEEQVIAQTRLDVNLFATQIARRIGITKRYIGEEPECPVTNAYNKAMLDILPQYGIEISVIKRIEIDGEVISASKVRDLIRLNKWEEIKKIVPDTTYSYLVAPETKLVLEKIRHSHSRH
ncbi:[citrate (pro-3S)-lyase] ligase [Anaerospora hongkongensis]|uniref:[Citrate [pro-3S]-lyase] ligase n=1 Tax=Anaerospora hongkongensis TaxID=244830 RepID=A0A4V2Q8S2_9FIRM|nr:[citrate (pro-3S)-lyase] ligase [Anaerospora hongkongensis]TCL38197.1 [citrate (pro-3S)-lyase] ligase [Anaerospora hongkongensis]